MSDVTGVKVKGEVKKKFSTYQLAFIGIMTAILCILGPLSIPLPFSPVPITFTNLAIYLTVFILGWKKGTISYLIYLLVGLVGLPVFSGAGAGFAKLGGPTGGYLIGFIFMAIISGLFIDIFSGKIVYSILGMVLGTAITYIFGSIWLGYQLNISFMKALMTGVVPYLPGDAIKIIAIALIGPSIRSSLRKAGLTE